MQTIDLALSWIEAAERPTGGIAAWQNPDGTYHYAYPETSGYLLPTLLKYGKEKLARRLKDWLLEIQLENGSWPHTDGLPAIFDTAAIIGGLRSFSSEPTVSYSIQRAEEWARSQLPHPSPSPVYLARAEAIVNFLPEFRIPWWATWRPVEGRPERLHYICYWLEGLLMWGQEDTVRMILDKIPQPDSGIFAFSYDEHFQPNLSKMDFCATCQMAWLYGKLKLRDPKPYLEAVAKHQRIDGGLPLSPINGTAYSWVAKYFLDAYAEA